MTNQLYVGNLSKETTEDSLRQVFAQGGRTVTAVHLITKGHTGKPRGFGFVVFGTEEEALSAMEALNGTELDGREIVVNVANERQLAGGGFGTGGSGGGARRSSGPRRW